MTVHLRQSRDTSSLPDRLPWLAVTGTPSAQPRETRLPKLARRLEASFVASRQTWWDIGRLMGEDPSAVVSHTAACGTFGSDFGLMLAWSHLVQELVVEQTDCLVLCDDPWLFRHLAQLPGVSAGPAPALGHAWLKLKLRGFISRGRLVLRLIAAWFLTRRLRPAHRPGDTTILVYGHPNSDSRGHDAYFGSLMREHPALKRLLHCDCPPGLARRLAEDGRTASLHAWGSLFFACGLLGAKWTPRRALLEGPLGWLIRRAAAQENGGGGPAMNRWQIHCQGRWLAAAAPRAVLWPWENHAWERALCRQARAAGVKSLGYQHTVIGPHQINYAIHSNPDGLLSIPDTVIADGPAYRDEMAAWGVPEDRLLIGGALRFELPVRQIYDPAGPVFFPLSAVREIAALQLEAARQIAGTGRQVLLKQHPMYPFAFTETQGLRRTETTLVRQKALSAVVYATGTSGLEALLAGLPAFRLLAEDRLSIDVLPTSLTSTPVELGELAAALAHARPPSPTAWTDVLTPADWNLWRALLAGAKHTPTDNMRMTA